MAAFIPNRRDPEVNEAALAKVREDKTARGRRRLRRHLGRPSRPRADGRRRSSTPVLGERPNQIDAAAARGVRDRRAAARRRRRRRARSPRPGSGSNVSVGIQYLAAWLQRHRRGGDLQPHGGRRHRRDLALAGLAVDPPRPYRPASACSTIAGEEIGDAPASRSRRGDREVFEQVALADEFVEFLTLPAYELL